jgi:hypothetical protein
MSQALKQQSLYTSDFFAWTQDQAAKLRARGGFDNRGDIDWENAAEEIEGLGDSVRSEIESRVAVLVLHLLKWRYQADHRSSSWKGTIVEQRGRIARRLKRNPSLRQYPAEVLHEEYESARLLAAGETGLSEDTFPSECPFSIEDVLDLNFYPESA